MLSLRRFVDFVLPSFISKRLGLSAALALTALVLLLGFLFHRTNAIDVAAQNRVMLDVRELAKRDAEWDVNILRARTGLDPGYAALEAPLPGINELLVRLHGALAMTSGPAAAEAYRRLRHAFNHKQSLVNAYKSHNAILRESLAYLPSAVTDLKTELTGIEGALVPARRVLALDAALNALLSDILRYNLAPNPRLAAQIDTTLEAVQAQRDPFSPAVRVTIDELVRHSHAVLRYRPLENQLEFDIRNAGTAQAIEQLGRAFDRSFGAELLHQQHYRTFLIIYAGLLLLLLLYAARRLRRSYSIINEVNRRLQSANETLELRVAERTAELEAQSEQLRQLARHDSLTGLINYGQLTRLLEHALVRAGRRGTTVVVMFIDLDGFKAVNDTYGHAAGDLVLQEVAKRVSARLRREDALARLGGDEFVILLEEVVSRDGALRVAQLALEEISGITEVGGHRVKVSASIGVSAAHGRAGAERGAAALLAEADQAMYRTKQAGKAGYTVSEHAQWGPAPPALQERGASL